MILSLLLAVPAAAQTTITFWHGYSELETVVLEQELIPRFEAAHPGITVEAVRLGYDDLRDKLVATAATGMGPDVACADIIWNPSLAAQASSNRSTSTRFADILDEVYPGPLSTVP